MSKSSLVDTPPLLNQEIEQAIESIEAEGRYASVDAVYRRLGRSRVRIANYLKSRRQRRSGSIDTQSQGLAPELISAMRTLQMRLESEALNQISAAQESHESEQVKLYDELRHSLDKIHLLESSLSQTQGRESHLQAELEKLRAAHGKLLNEHQAALTRLEEKSEHEALLQSQIEQQQAYVKDCHRQLAEQQSAFQSQIQGMNADFQMLMKEQQQRHQTTLDAVLSDHHQELLGHKQEAKLVLEAALRSAESSYRQQIHETEKLVAEWKERWQQSEQKLLEFKRRQAMPWRRGRKEPLNQDHILYK